MCPIPRSTRREFLQGKSAVDALAEVAGDVGEQAVLAEPSAGHYLLKLARKAMACQFEIFLNAGQYPEHGEAGLAALDLVDALEDQLSTYRETSEVSRLNRSAADGPIKLEPRFFALLQQAVAIHTETEGAYDITAGPLSRVWGFTRRAGSIPDPQTLNIARACVGSQLLIMDDAEESVQFARPGIEINLGSIGKGYALDRCAELLTAAGIHDFLLHGGNSSVLARGSNGALGAEGGWIVGVRNPLRPDRRLGELRLRGRALATSGSGTQFFVHDGRRYGHILDPRSGWPAEGVLSVSVLAPTAAEADALSTAFYVMGPTKAEAYCQRHPEIGALMLCPGERSGSIEKHRLGVNELEWTEVADSA